MKHKPIPFIRLTLVFLSFLVLMNGIAMAGKAKPADAHHELTIHLFPESAELEGRDRIRISEPQSGPIHLSLSPRARVQAVRIDGRDHPYTLLQGRLTLTPDENGWTTLPLELDIRYRCRFDDPAPVRPVNTDNPGFGVSGTISPLGTFILSGAGWYPQMANARESFDLLVEGPKDTVAVTAGRLKGIAHRNSRTVSHWTIDHPLEGLSLSAGPYVVDQKSGNGITVATYFSPENQPLSTRYLETSLHYLKRYSDLFGDYPFDGFAVVENFFPTGYGFPGYTLMGGRVLRLPFIPETSLPHEIVHNWWGNGVLVDSASGNWCEGLTSYTADYLNKEQISSAAAMDYRRQALRNYASLVSPTADFPLSRFQGRTDPVTKAVGYDKCAMVFHMLRREMDDAAFWTALKAFYRQFLFQDASWQDLQQIFERHAERSLDGFFRQWVERPGAPQLRLKDVRQEASKGGYRTSGRLVQEKPYYDITLALALITDSGPVEQTVHVSGRQARFEIPSTGRPLALTADPDYHLFRRLTPEEMPPTVNTLKSAASAVLVVANRLDRFGPLIARRFARAMGLDPIHIINETDFSLADAAENDLLFIGLPEGPEWVGMLPRELELTPKSFKLAGKLFDETTDVLFFVARHPDRSGNVVSLLHPLSPDAANPATLKIPHYGRFSYLAFSDGRNQAKGTWKVQASPMMVRWDPVKKP